MLQTLTRLFPVWALIFSTYAFFQPGLLSGQKAQIVPCLMVIMLGMGMTLSAADFKNVLARPQIILLGIGIQFLWMPLLALVISRTLSLPQDMLIGMVLVGSVAGGTASNVICYLAKADVALSISMTLVSTLVAVLVTPFLTWLYLGHSVEVPVLAMLAGLVKIVLLPVIMGVCVNQYLGKYILPVKDFFPLLSVIAIVYVIGIIVSLNVDRMSQVGWAVLMAVILHNLGGLLSGYASARILRQSPRVCRTIAIEVGMQNSGLAVALATQYFAPLAALPGALFSVWHNLSGSLLAFWWSRRSIESSA